MSSASSYRALGGSERPTVRSCPSDISGARTVAGVLLLSPLPPLRHPSAQPGSPHEPDDELVAVAAARRRSRACTIGGR